MGSLVLKIFLAVVQALPLVLDEIRSQRAKDKQEKLDAAIESDPLGEFEHKFGRLQSDTESDFSQPGSEDLHNAETKRN